MLLTSRSPRNKRKETRKTRRDHIERRNEAFRLQLEALVDAYMRWDAGLGPNGLEAGAPPPAEEGGLVVQVIDTFREFSRVLELPAIPCLLFFI